MKYGFRFAARPGSVKAARHRHLELSFLWLIESLRRPIPWSELEEIICARHNAESDDKHSLAFPRLHLNSPRCQLWKCAAPQYNIVLHSFVFIIASKRSWSCSGHFSAVRRPREQMWLRSHFGVMQTMRNLQFNKGLDSHSYVTTQREHRPLDFRVKKTQLACFQTNMRFKLTRSSIHILLHEPNCNAASKLHLKAALSPKLVLVNNGGVLLERCKRSRAGYVK